MSTSDEEELVGGPPLSINPYEVLGLGPEATHEEVKSAYRKLALRNHPDKVKDESKDIAHTKFQEIAFAYAVLSDPGRRSRYDATGNTSESLGLDDENFNWMDFFRSQKADIIDGNSIQKIKEEYQHSEEERSDLLATFERCQGDMDAVYEEMMCSNVLEDDERFRSIIDDAISRKEVTEWKRYKRESGVQKRKRVARANKEEVEARQRAEELGVAGKLFGSGNAGGTRKKKDDHSALSALIQQKQRCREDAFFDNLAAKYGGAEKAGKGKKRTPVDEPPEEAFQKNRKKVRV